MKRIDDNDCLVDTPLGPKRWSTIQRMMETHGELLAATKDLVRLVSHVDMETHWDNEALSDSVECALRYAKEAIQRAEGGA